MADEGAGHEMLEGLWWDTMDALQDAINFSDDRERQIMACDVFLKYVNNLNIGLHDPFIPKTKPKVEDGEDDDD